MCKYTELYDVTTLNTEKWLIAAQPWELGQQPVCPRGLRSALVLSTGARTGAAAGPSPAGPSPCEALLLPGACPRSRAGCSARGRGPAPGLNGAAALGLRSSSAVEEPGAGGSSLPVPSTWGCCRRPRPRVPDGLSLPQCGLELCSRCSGSRRSPRTLLPTWTVC